MADKDTPEPKIEKEELKSSETHEVTSSEPELEAKPLGKSNPLKRMLNKFRGLSKPKQVVISLGLLIVILAAVPATRYPLLSLVKKQNLDVVVNDSRTDKPITEAEVAINGRTAKTDKEGKAHLSGVKLGQGTLIVTKKYYKETTQSLTVPLRSPKGPIATKLEATGRQVEVKVNNKISGAPVENVFIKALDTEVRTDKEGKAIVVLPADKDSVEGTLSLKGYNDTTIVVKVTETKAPENSFKITPKGKIYFLSKLSGKIDVVKTDLDGGDRQTVLAGTGKEEEGGTVLLASRDWKYLALQSKRDGGDHSKLFLIDTTSDKLTTMDEGKATFAITGWLDHDFIYQVSRDDVQYWQPKQSALKSFNAENQKITVLDETSAETSTHDGHNAYERYGSIFALKGVVLFSKSWNSNAFYTTILDDKKAAIISVQGDGSKKTTLKTSQKQSGSNTTNISFEAKAYEAGGVYFKPNLEDTLYEYEDGKLSATTEITLNDFYSKTYPTFLQSPDSKENFWSESRDGKNTLFIGDEDGEDGKQIAALSEFNQYGWFTDDYLLVSKNSSELYILPKQGGDPIKISDYHKPTFNYYGYGGGYGGI